ncbi:MAG: HD domain-containing protein [Sphingobacteriales bacterium]|nr:MAG: HD domain-containing protein [Sphingobacteriales bacterium]
MSEYSQILKVTEEYVSSMYDEYTSPCLHFHNLEHTKQVVKRTNEIAAHYELSSRDSLILFIAAWFHDTGYLFVSPQLHEEKSVELMREFAAKVNLDATDIEEIAACIMVTKMPRNPENALQKIMCDADTYHLGTKDFKKYNKTIKKEFSCTAGETFSLKNFNEHTIGFFNEHVFYTDYCRQLLNEQKTTNMKKLSKKIKADELMAELQGPTDEPKQIVEKRGTMKGVQTMLRLTSSNHIQLSEMADSKANILISVNAIIISVILTVMLRKLQTDPYLTIPSFLFLAFSVATIVTAILATRPKLSSGVFMEDDIQNKTTNLLFFGNFHKMQVNQYDKAMRTMMQDPDYLYSSMIQDIYYLGAVLGKKYRLIRLSYNIFMIGIIISVAAFAIAALINAGTTTAGTVTNSTGSPF